MIQVIERIGKILDVVALDPEGVQLKVIEDATSLNKGTLCNLLKSLCDIGFVEKRQSGIYTIGRKLRTLAYPQFMNETLFTLASEIAKRLAAETRESGLVAIRQDNQLQVVAREIFDQGVIINAKVFENMPGFNTAVGHIFLAFDDDIDLQLIHRTELHDMYPTFPDLMAKLASIRKELLFIKEIPGRNAIAAAVPVFRDGILAAALAMVVPDIRFNHDSERRLIATLVSFGKKMSRALS